MVRRIYMTGVMSSGKTSIASALAKSFVASFYKEEINETLLRNTFQEKNPDVTLALYVRSLNNGPWFGINENEKYKNLSAHGRCGIQHHLLSGQVSG
jgi:chloramphenicol 3-O-phosphotransferase